MSDAVDLLCRVRPPSINNRSGKAREAFRAALRTEWEALARPTRTGLLYGLVVWFVREYRSGIDPDADNISKAVWDTLAGDLGAFADDKQIRLRTAMIIDVAGGDPTMEYLDPSSLPGRVVNAIAEAIEAPELKARQHVTYIRFGELEPRMIAGALSAGHR